MRPPRRTLCKSLSATFNLPLSSSSASLAACFSSCSFSTSFSNDSLRVSGCLQLFLQLADYLLLLVQLGEERARFRLCCLQFGPEGCLHHLLTGQFFSEAGDAAISFLYPSSQLSAAFYQLAIGLLYLGENARFLLEAVLEQRSSSPSSSVNSAPSLRISFDASSNLADSA
ncbi:hypothetical protein MTO96_012465 [Rhipicephalus appendiculatus]